MQAVWRAEHRRVLVRAGDRARRGLGLLIDRWLGTSPWGFFIFFVFGLVAGVLNVYRTAGKFLK